jgi:polyhydroxyalkanoate synthesis regulator phasin
MNEYDREYGLYADEYTRLLKSLEGAKETYNDSLADDENFDVLNGVRNSIITKAESFSTNAQLSDYISGLVNKGELTKEQGDALFEKYIQGEEDFKDRTWTKVEGDNGVFIGKLNDDAKVKDEYGHEYRLDELVKKLQEQGMTKEKAIEFAAKYN